MHSLLWYSVYFVTGGILTGLFVALAAILHQYLTFNKCPPGLRPLPSPPGRLPLIGHRNIVKQGLLRDHFIQWQKEYGEVYQVQMGNFRYVVVSSDVAVKEIMDRHSAVTSSRKPAPMMSEIVSGGKRMLFMPYGEDWRRIRQVIHGLLTPRASDKFKPSQDLESKKYLYDLLTDNEDNKRFYQHVRRYTSSVIMMATYGKRVETLEDRDLQEIYEELMNFSTTLGRGAFIVDEFPIIARLIPKPFQWWRPYGEKLHKLEATLWLRLWRELEAKMENGTAPFCYVRGFMEQKYKEMGVSELQGAYVAGSMIEAGSDTTSMTLNSLILGLLANPRVVLKAQEELDRVVGSSRMPTFGDEKELLYIRAIVKEVLRWRPTITLGVTHYSTADIVYNGYYIPKDSIIFLNQWGINHDPARHSDPDTFKPERYLGDDTNAAESAALADATKRDHFTFGAGRRICSGIHLAENPLFMLTARLLWGFDLSPPIDPKTGKPAHVDTWAYEPGASMIPKRFEAIFKVRGSEREQIIRREWEIAKISLNK